MPWSNEHELAAMSMQAFNVVLFDKLLCSAKILIFSVVVSGSIMAHSWFGPFSFISNSLSVLDVIVFVIVIETFGMH